MIPRMRRVALKTLAGIVLLVALLGLVAYGYLRRSLPAVDGAFVVSGIGNPVEIIRDADSIPHIFASTRLDALYGLGYVHAQDRLWQMEFQLRIGHGRLSESSTGDGAPGSLSPDIGFLARGEQRVDRWPRMAEPDHAYVPA